MYRQLKERQVEDHLFGDKEKFVTSAYKKKLQEQQLWQAEQKIRWNPVMVCRRRMLLSVSTDQINMQAKLSHVLIVT